MKKYAIVALLSLTVALITTSCKKEKHEEIVLEQSLEKTLKVNESITFTLPASLSDDEYQITTSAAHAYVSKLSEDLSGNTLYCYTPEKDFVGSDFVIVSTVEENHKDQHGHHGGHHAGSAMGGGGGHCNKGGHPTEQQLKISIYLTIEKEVKADIIPSKLVNATK